MALFARSSRAFAARSFATTAAPTTASPTAVLMLNLGGPATQDEVSPFLHRLFADREIMTLPMQSITGPLIAKRRVPKIKAQYMSIGGGSPIRRWTDEQGRALVRLLDAQHPETAPHKHYIAFRYAEPLTQDALQSMAADGVKRAVVFTQYPQYSCSTTGSSLNELFRQIGNSGLEKAIQWSVIDRWYTHPGLVKSFAHLIEEALVKNYAPEDRDKVVLLFSAHSLPMMVVNRGDPYPQEVAATVQRVMEDLGFRNQFRLVWQSQVGPLPWLGPQLLSALDGLAANKRTHVMAIPIAFTSDHVETLFEIDIEVAKHAKQLGIEFSRSESLNAHPLFVQALADVATEHLKANKPCSKQMLLRCPGCINDFCATSKAFFASQQLSPN